MKKLFLLALTAFMLLMSVCVTASDEFVYTYEVLPDGTAAITGASGLNYMCEIPKEIDGYTVSALGNGSPLTGFDGVDSVTLNANVKTIGSKAFYGSKSLDNIYNSYVTNVGSYAFYGCESLDTFSFEKLEYIGEGAFAYCKKLGGIDSRIKLNSLVNCDGAEYPYLKPNGKYGYNTLAEAEKAPFYGCDGITSIEITCPFRYEVMDVMFLNCRRITHVYVHDFNGSLNVWEFMLINPSTDGTYDMDYHVNAIMFTSMGEAAKNYAESKYMVFVPMYSTVKVIVNGEEIVSDQSALLMNSRTMVPLRAIFEKLGAEVFWDDAAKTVTALKDNTEIELTIGQYFMRVNSKIVELDVAPLIFNSRTLVPLRAISEAFDNEVLWDSETKTVTVESKSEAPLVYRKKDIIKAENGDIYTVYYNDNGKRLYTTKEIYSAEGELVSSEAVEEYTYNLYGDLEKRVHPDGTVELFTYDVLHDLSHYEIYYANGTFKTYDYTKQRNENCLLYLTKEPGDNPEIGDKITHYSYYYGWETLSEIRDNYGKSLKFYYVHEDDYENDIYKTSNESIGVPLDYVIVVSDEKVVDKYKGSFEKYTELVFYNADGDKYTDVYDLGEVIESVTQSAANPEKKPTGKFAGIDYDKAMATGKDAKFFPSVATMFDGEKSPASESAYQMYPNRTVGEDATLFSAANVICDAIYNLDYRDNEAIATVYERLQNAIKTANGNPSPIRGGVMYSFPSVFDAQKNVEKKVISEAFFASSPENCIQLNGTMPFCLLQTIKGYLYIKYSSFDDPAFTLELDKWYRTEVEITLGYTQTPSSGVHHTASIASRGFEEVPEELLITE